ncbi:adenylosuccinate synthase [Cellulomonas hominis]|uniref:Adenylosuccinate synthetase n=1 Tax=Cellulomonas hominis TaxID=156981 RepID=A0A7Z8K280_9CELL|nr:adenylosuccinate synthetase [Cellulomonas hominis]TKR27006.1 adenylosuccinate synthase [Cellulomonas hominis]
MDIVVALSGAIAVGKSTVASKLVDRWGGTVVKTRDALVDLASKRGVDLTDRRAMQAFGDVLDRETAGRWVSDAAHAHDADDSRLLIVDAVRIREQIDELRVSFGRRLVHVHLVAADRSVLAERYRERRRDSVAELASYEMLAENSTQANIDELGKIADVVLDTHRNTIEDIVIRCAARLGLLPALTAPLVDVVVGGQFGSEGKGNIAYHLAPEYGVLVRVGGPNAGHKVRHDGAVLTHRTLPSGSRANPQAPLVVGPGGIVNPLVLLNEIAETGVDPARVKIDPQVMVINQDDIEREAGLVGAIASTGQGVGAAAARRILGRDGSTKLARDHPELQPFLAETGELLNDAFAAGHYVLVEGTQGTGLSVFHGQYPHVTSRDTTIAGTLSEAGIGPRRVRRAIVTIRTYPIRVAGNSGDIGHGRELQWSEIEQRSRHEAGDIQDVSSVTKRVRRVAEFDWELLRRSAELNSATDIALTFADYLDRNNKNAYRYEQLTGATIEFVEEVESVTGAAVSLIATSFLERGIIDRRTWRGARPTRLPTAEA